MLTLSNLLKDRSQVGLLRQYGHKLPVGRCAGPLMQKSYQRNRNYHRDDPLANDVIMEPNSNVDYKFIDTITRWMIEEWDIRTNWEYVITKVDFVKKSSLSLMSKGSGYCPVANGSVDSKTAYSNMLKLFIENGILQEINTVFEFACAVVQLVNKRHIHIKRKRTIFKMVRKKKVKKEIVEEIDVDLQEINLLSVMAPYPKQEHTKDAPRGVIGPTIAIKAVAYVVEEISKVITELLPESMIIMGGTKADIKIQNLIQRSMLNEELIYKSDIIGDITKWNECLDVLSLIRCLQGFVPNMPPTVRSICECFGWLMAKKNVMFGDVTLAHRVQSHITRRSKFYDLDYSMLTNGFKEAFNDNENIFKQQTAWMAETKQKAGVALSDWNRKGKGYNTFMGMGMANIASTNLVVMVRRAAEMVFRQLHSTCRLETGMLMSSDDSMECNSFSNKDGFNNYFKIQFIMLKLAGINPSPQKTIITAYTEETPTVEFTTKYYRGIRKCQMPAQIATMARPSNTNLSQMAEGCYRNIGVMASLLGTGSFYIGCNSLKKYMNALIGMTRKRAAEGTMDYHMYSCDKLKVAAMNIEQGLIALSDPRALANYYNPMFSSITDTEVINTTDRGQEVIPIDTNGPFSVTIYSRRINSSITDKGEAFRAGRSADGIMRRLNNIGPQRMVQARNQGNNLAELICYVATDAGARGLITSAELRKVYKALNNKMEKEVVKEIFEEQ